MTPFVWYSLAALAEIAGCYTFWMWLRLGRSIWWLVPGIVSLCLFAWFLTRIDAPMAGRAYAAYGGIYIFISLLWMWLLEKGKPDLYDTMGVALCLAGTAVILLPAR